MIVKHPTLKNVAREIPDADADRWAAQGWVVPAPAKKAASKPKPRKRS